MESGQNNLYTSLLTISIPTWNRSAKLKTALQILMPQVTHHSGLIEVIISDNNSSDDTLLVVQEIEERYPNVYFRYYKQDINTGFYGNFKNCYSLASGKYIWLLSDDDFVFAGVIDLIITLLLGFPDIGAIFLNDWTQNRRKKEPLSYKLLSKSNFFQYGNYRHTLISSIIHIRSINSDDKLFNELKDNALIAYPIFIKSVYKYDRFININGNSLLVANDEAVRFNALKIFTIDLAECLDTAYKFLPEKTVNYIANSFLSTLIAKHYSDFKFHKMYQFQESNSFRYFKYYLKYKNFWIYILPMVLLSQKRYDNTKYLVKNILKSK